MTHKARLLIGCGLALGLAIGGAGLVSAEQQNDPIASLLQAPPPKLREPQSPTRTEPAAPAADKPAPAEPDAPAPSAPLAAASDDSQDDGPAASSKAPPKPPEPMKRPRYAIAVIQALDKVSAESMRFEAPINQPIRYKSLIFVVRACETNAPDEPTGEAAAHVEIVSQPKGPDGQAPPPSRQVFRGWMFANAPGLNLFQHPVYDAWLIACKTAAPSA